VVAARAHGIEEVDDAVHLNRALRSANLLRVREEEGLELLDAGASRALAVADHQVAHVYVPNPDDMQQVREICAAQSGVEQVLGRDEQERAGINHERAGELVCIAEPRRWFSYYYWLDDAAAPDFARTVDIHRKPGYDPCELFFDPKLSAPKARVAAKLLKKKLGFRTLMDVIPLDTKLVRGSHGRVEQEPQVRPIVIASEQALHRYSEVVTCTALKDVILREIFG
jgi:hypothetical protein